MLKKIGIITIHKIFNYGSVLQAYALQKVCEELGYNVEIIDYNFPNKFHNNNNYAHFTDKQQNEPKWIKLLFSLDLLRQHRSIKRFVSKYQNLSSKKYNSPDDLKNYTPIYDIYISGSDQIWNPRYCNGDPAYMLHFASDKSLKISYATSINSDILNTELVPLYKQLLSRYKNISVREESGVRTIKEILGKEPIVALDPTLLLNFETWNQLAVKKIQLKKKYILCYFMNYAFNAFPYVDEFIKHIQKQTGYEIVHVARPPHKFEIRYNHYRIGASPEEFLSLIRDSEMVVTTSFHGTAFAVNYGKPVFSIVKEKNASDSRQISLMRACGLEQNVISIMDPFPDSSQAYYNIKKEQEQLCELRKISLNYLNDALLDE